MSTTLHRLATQPFAAGATALGLALAFALALGAAPAWAGNVTVQVQSASGQALADAVVFVESPQAKAAVKPARGVEVQQAERSYVPLVSVVTVGTEVSFPNRDKVRHHVYSFSPAKTFELKLYAGTPANPVLFDKPGIVVLGCNIHDRMTAWIVVVETPHHGRSAADGLVTLRDVPSGAYRLRVWHPNMPVGSAALDQPLVVGGGAISLTVQVPGKGA